MSPKRNSKGKQAVEASGTRNRSSRSSNPYNIVFEDDAHAKMYYVLIIRKITHTRYMCEQTLTDLGLKFEVYRMFHSIGLLEFMYMEVSAYERTTIEFLSTLDFNLHSVITLFSS